MKNEFFKFVIKMDFVLRWFLIFFFLWFFKFLKGIILEFWSIVFLIDSFVLEIILIFLIWLFIFNEKSKDK